jgi:hypothetical protein
MDTDRLDPSTSRPTAVLEMPSKIVPTGPYSGSHTVYISGLQTYGLRLCTVCAVLRTTEGALFAKCRVL